MDCTDCKGEGVIKKVQEGFKTSQKKVFHYELCDTCKGKGVQDGGSKRRRKRTKRKLSRKRKSKKKKTRRRRRR